MLGIIPVPQYISNILYLPGYDIRYIRMEKVIMEYLDVVNCILIKRLMFS